MRFRTPPLSHRTANRAPAGFLSGCATMLPIDPRRLIGLSAKGAVPETLVSTLIAVLRAFKVTDIVARKYATFTREASAASKSSKPPNPDVLFFRFALIILAHLRPLRWCLSTAWRPIPRSLRIRTSRRPVSPKRWSRCGSILAWSLICFVCTSLGVTGEACAADDSFLDPQGIIAAAQHQHFILIVLLTMIVILPVLIGVPLIAWRYRYRNTSARYLPKWDHSGWIEAVIWGIPVAIVIVLSFWLAHGAATLDPYRPLKSQNKKLTVDVIGYDWKWLFVYPQLHIASIGKLVFPEHTSLSMRLTSDTVMQSFSIPALGSQIYAMAAMQTKLHLVADSTGQFLGENTQYDGMGFQNQKFIARATTSQGFDDWVHRVKANGIPLTAKVYSVVRKHNTVPEIHRALRARNMPPDAVFFKDVQPDLYRNVLMSFHGHSSSSRAVVTASDARVGNAASADDRKKSGTAETG